MKSMLKLVVIKQCKSYIAIILALVMLTVIVLEVESSSNKIFNMPIAVQDMDQSKASHELIDNLEQTKYINIVKIPQDEAYIEDVIQKKQAIVSFQIPKGFSKKLKHNDLRDALPLYYKDDFVGEIALEVTSKALYKEQIPIIIKEHLNHAKVNKTESDIKKEIKAKTPHSKLEQHSIKQNADVSISAGLMVALILLASCSQIVLHRKLKQNAALDRLMMFHGTKIKLYFVYIAVHTILIFLFICLLGLILSWSLSWVFYVTTFIMILVYEIGICTLLFKINTVSHRLFMAIIWSLAISILYLFLQI